MKTFAKILSVFTNLCSYGVGIAVVLILILKKDFISIFYINGMTSNESLYFNMILFEAVLALTGIVICMLAKEYGAENITVEFPTVFTILPIILGGISIYYGFAGETAREKAVVIICALLYILLSAVILYTGSKIFQLYPKNKS
ncbi:MAG: hypothetical protein ACLUFN_09920 [Eubacterium sp.]